MHILMVCWLTSRKTTTHTHTFRLRKIDWKSFEKFVTIPSRHPKKMRASDEFAIEICLHIHHKYVVILREHWAPRIIECIK